MHRNWFLILLPAVACQADPQRGPTPTTVAIMETEPAASTSEAPALSAFLPEVAAEPSVESDGFEQSEAVATELDPAVLPHALGVEVRAGENLVLLARWADSSVEAVAELNGLDVTEPLYPGQSLLLPTTDDAADQALVQSREAFAQARLSRYLERRGGLMAVEEHRVRTGETAWSIAKEQHGIPPWVLAAYNPGADLERLGIGDRLQVPVLSDTVAAVEEPAPPALEVEPWEIGPEGTVFDEVALPEELELPSIGETVRIGSGGAEPVEELEEPEPE